MTATPLPTAETLSGLSGKLQGFGEKAIDAILTYGPRVLIALIVLWIGLKIAKKVHKKVHAKTVANPKIDTTLGNFFSNLIRFGIIAATVLTAVSIVGVKVAALFTIFSAAVLAIGLALEGSIANVAAGLLLIVFRPYKIGDYIEANGEEGIVEDINVFTTTLRTLDNVKVIIANGQAQGETIRNFTSLGKRRVDIDFGIDYGDDMDKAIKIIKDTAAKDARVMKDPDGPWAKVSCLNESSVDIQMRVWCKAEEYWDVRFDLMKDVKEAFDKGGISIPYPHGVEIMR